MSVDPSLRRARSALAAAAAVALFVLPGEASARPLRPVDPTPPARTVVAPFHDRVLPGDTAPRARPAEAQLYRTRDGTRVSIAVSPSYDAGGASQAAAQTYADLLGSRVHGPELAQLRVFIGTARDIRRRCGGDAVACYYSRPQQTMYVPGEQTSSGIPSAYAVTHEYGHHVASYRRNDLGPAFDLGPEYWASEEHVCSGVLRRRFFPGDEGRHYRANPGEGWADAYAHLPEQGFTSQPFRFDVGFRPDPAAEAAIRRDVLAPWPGPVVRTASGAFGPGQRVVTLPFRTTLDGRLVLRLRGPRRANYDLQVLDERGRLVSRTRARGSRDRLSALVCRSPGVAELGGTVRVVRRSGSGPFSLTSSLPQ